jgi:amino acid transporter
MAMCIGSSVAELVSAYPTAGGMYFVTKHVVPEEQVPIFSWIQGWCNLLGQTAGVSSVAYTVSQMLLACASMNSEIVDGQYSYSPYVRQRCRGHIVSFNLTNVAELRLKLLSYLF